MLKAYGIPVVETRLAASEDEAVAAAREIGFPVVLKLNSHTITHKTDVGGVKLNLCGRSRGPGRVPGDSGVGQRERPARSILRGVSVQPMISAEGYELILGSSIDAQFGPVLLFGAGGQLVEVFQRSRARAAAAQYHAGAPLHGADQNLHSAERRARPEAGEHRGA